VEPDTGLDLRTLRSWPELKSRVGRLTDWATQALLISRYFLLVDGIPFCYMLQRGNVSFITKGSTQLTPFFEILADSSSPHCSLWWSTALSRQGPTVIPFCLIGFYCSLNWYSSIFSPLFSFSPPQSPTQRLKVVLGPTILQICASNIQMLKCYWWWLEHTPLCIPASMAGVTLPTPFPLPNALQG